MAKRGHYGRWSELDLLMAIGTYRSGGAGLNECSRIYNVPKATIKRHADEQNSTAVEIKPRKRSQARHGLSALVEGMREKAKTKNCKESAQETTRKQMKTIKSRNKSSPDTPNGDLSKSESCKEAGLETPTKDIKSKFSIASALEIPNLDINLKTSKESGLGTSDRDVEAKTCKKSALETPDGEVKAKVCKESALKKPDVEIKSKSCEESVLKTTSGHVNNSKANISKRGQYGRWSENDLLKAVAAYKNGKKGLNECSRIYNIPKATLKRHADGKNSIANEIKSLGRQPTFSPVMEKILSEYLLHLKESYFGLTIKEIRKLVFEIAEKHGLPHSFNKNKKMAGKKWFYSFLKRNPQLSLQKSESQSISLLHEST